MIILKWLLICLAAGFILAILDTIFKFSDWPDEYTRAKGINKIEDDL